MSQPLPVRLWLYLPWAILVGGIPLLLFWWAQEPPVEITYVAPAFLSSPAESREDAAQHYVTDTVGGGTLWRYIEYCVRRPYSGVSHRAWVSRSVVWHAPDLPTYLSRATGCASASLAVEIPSSNPARRFEFVQYMETETMSNPLRTWRIDYSPIPLLILPPSGKTE